MSFREVREFCECLRTLGFHRVVSLSNFKDPNFELTAELIDWLISRLDGEITLPEDIETEAHRVDFITQAVAAASRSANIRMNARKLYGADSYAVKELLKVARYLCRARRLASNFGSGDRPLEDGASTAAVKSSMASAVGEDLRPMSFLSSEILEAGAKLHLLLGAETNTESSGGVKLARQKAVKFLEGISRNLNSEKEQTNVERQVKKKQVELERTSKRLEGLRKVRPAFMDEFEELQEYLEQLYEAYVDRFRNLDYLEKELDVINKEEQERFEEQERRLKALQKKLRDEEWKLLRGDMDTSSNMPIIDHNQYATEAQRPMSRDRNFRDGGRRGSRIRQQNERMQEGFRQMEHDEFGPSTGANMPADFDEPEFIDSASDGIVSIGSRPEEGLIGSSSTLNLVAGDAAQAGEDQDEDIIVESDGDAETLISLGGGSSSGEDVEIIEDTGFPEERRSALRYLGWLLLVPARFVGHLILFRMQAEKLFAIFDEFFNHESAPGEGLVDKVKATYTFEIFPQKVGSGESKKWTIDLKSKPGKCTTEEGGGDCLFQLSDKDFVQLAANKLNPQMAFMTGKLKIKGDLGKAMKFTPDLLPKVDMKVALDASKSPKDVVALVLSGGPKSKL
ncbi:Clusterin-associated protein 1 [Perkinsus chesapeaki]|uniref:Clusterin-associated protein 1 n=1 Tax=Perkinsus chesapeaki TaxID=330153 RepID=A0A7J6LK97_PERCH|nr:Clusterin-associated protein 1 [Perkinsus chesapeaki]